MKDNRKFQDAAVDIDLKNPQNLLGTCIHQNFSDINKDYFKKELIGDWIAVLGQFTIYIYNQDEKYVYVQGIEVPMYYHTKGKSLFLYRNENRSDILEYVRF